jgi:hypothetical protein
VKNIKSVIGVVAVSAVLSLGFSGIAYAGDAKMKNVSEFLCKDILRTSGEDRDIAVAFMHGYLLGKSGKDAFNRDTLSAATDGFIEACLNNTGAVAVDTLRKQLK